MIQHVSGMHKALGAVPKNLALGCLKASNSIISTQEKKISEVI